MSTAKGFTGKSNLRCMVAFRWQASVTCFSALVKINQEEPIDDFDKSVLLIFLLSFVTSDWVLSPFLRSEPTVLLS